MRLILNDTRETLLGAVTTFSASLVIHEVVIDAVRRKRVAADIDARAAVTGHLQVGHNQIGKVPLRVAMFRLPLPVIFSLVPAA